MPAEDIAYATKTGQTHFGENYVKNSMGLSFHFDLTNKMTHLIGPRIDRKKSKGKVYAKLASMEDFPNL